VDRYATLGNGFPTVASPVSPAHVALGRAIRDFRGDRDISQEELAHLSHLGRKTIYQLEGGFTNPRYETLLRVAGALDICLGDLVAHADELAEKAAGRRRGQGAPSSSS
jgi:transcriptional regulator with XRE-family HTH domain